MKAIIDKLDTLLEEFEPIGLSDMESVKLLNRTDTKFVFSINRLPGILQDLMGNYKLVYINDLAQQPYYTVYFDTPECAMYLTHQNGKLHRYKIRYRNYESTNTGFLEIKLKNNKGRTQKKRIPFNFETNSIDKANNFLQTNSPYSSDDIVPQSIVKYTRLTLVNIENGERVTVDYNLRVKEYEDRDNISNFSHIAIIEVKRDKSNTSSVITNTLLKHRIFKSGMSKYCIGMASIHDALKKNTFKQKLRKLDKIKELTTN